MVKGETKLLKGTSKVKFATLNPGEGMVSEEGVRLMLNSNTYLLFNLDGEVTCHNNPKGLSGVFGSVRKFKLIAEEI